jgi:hypothetical protein
MMIGGISGPVFDESAEMGDAPKRKQLELPRQMPLRLPKALTPLIIPPSSPALVRFAEQESKGDETRGPDVPPKSARMLEFPPAPNISASDANAIFSTKSQRKQTGSAPSDRACPQSWSTTLNIASSPPGRSQTPDIGYVFTHRSGAEGANSNMDRGRSKKAPNASPSQRMHADSITGSAAEERKAFEALSQSPAIASASMSVEEIKTLRNHAIGQATHFGVLSPKDVDQLSRVSRPGHFTHIITF